MHARRLRLYGDPPLADQERRRRRPDRPEHDHAQHSSRRHRASFPREGACLVRAPVPHELGRPADRHGTQDPALRPHAADVPPIPLRNEGRGTHVPRDERRHRLAVSGHVGRRQSRRSGDDLSRNARFSGLHQLAADDSHLRGPSGLRLHPGPGRREAPEGRARDPGTDCAGVVHRPGSLLGDTDRALVRNGGSGTRTLPRAQRLELPRAAARRPGSGGPHGNHRGAADHRARADPLAWREGRHQRRADARRTRGLSGVPRFSGAAHPRIHGSSELHPVRQGVARTDLRRPRYAARYRISERRGRSSRDTGTRGSRRRVFFI